MITRLVRVSVIIVSLLLLVWPWIPSAGLSSLRSPWANYTLHDAVLHLRRAPVEIAGAAVPFALYSGEGVITPKETFVTGFWSTVVAISVGLELIFYLRKVRNPEKV